MSKVIDAILGDDYFRTDQVRERENYKRYDDFDGFGCEILCDSRHYRVNRDYTDVWRESIANHSLSDYDDGENRFHMD